MGVSPHYAETHETHETSGGSLTLKTSDLRHEPASSWRNERAMSGRSGTVVVTSARQVVPKSQGKTFRPASLGAQGIWRSGDLAPGICPPKNIAIARDAKRRAGLVQRGRRWMEAPTDGASIQAIRSTGGSRGVSVEGDAGILVQKLKAEAKSAGGVLLPDSAKQEINQAKVMAIGMGRRNPKGEMIPMNTKVGDTVIIPRYGGTEIKLGDEEFHIYRDEATQTSYFTHFGTLPFQGYLDRCRDGDGCIEKNSDGCIWLADGRVESVVVTFAFPVNEALSMKRMDRSSRHGGSVRFFGSDECLVGQTARLPRHVAGVAARGGQEWALLIVPALAGKLFRASKNVYELDNTKIAGEVANARSPWVVMYYADWCPHCHHYAPTFERIAQKTSPLHQGPVSFGAVNCPDFMALCTKIQIAGYPTVRTYHFKGDVGNALSGSRPDRSMVHNEDQFVAWLRRNVPENVTQAEVVVEAVTKGSGPSDEPSMSSSAGRGVRGAPQVDEIRRDPPRSSVVQDAMPALHLADAEVAVLYSLRQGAFLRGEGGVLRGAPLVELLRWLDFLGRFFPGGGREHLRALADRIHEAVASAGDQLLVETFNEIMKTRGLDRIPPEAGLKPDAFWRHCHSFTCGLWSLFHMLSVAVAEEGPSTEIAGVAGQELLVRVRGFVDHFFGCSYCREHFLEAFDSCKLDRCVVEPEDISGAVLWLWKMHNDVTLRVAKEDGRKIPDPWPPSEDCLECWNCQTCWTKGSRSVEDFNSAAVLTHLRQEFWSDEWHQKRHWLSGDWTAHGAVPLALVSAFLLAFAAFKLLSRHLDGPDDGHRGKDVKDS
ncbi:unnamed protein product [Durusdinium trenchii]|uniref:Sulfhydryl oxidase n=1 Tax=Durusdinium trenchii TaxID=1381693 RepID=A0ABP0R8M3_9DINO